MLNYYLTHLQQNDFNIIREINNDKIRICLVLCFVLLSCAGQTKLSNEEVSEGWYLLFDDQTFDGWRGFKKRNVPKGWIIADKGELHFNGNGDIMTKEQFIDFELSLEWKISPKGNRWNNVPSKRR